MRLKDGQSLSSITTSWPSKSPSGAGVLAPSLATCPCTSTVDASSLSHSDVIDFPVAEADAIRAYLSLTCNSEEPDPEGVPCPEPSTESPSS